MISFNVLNIKFDSLKEPWRANAKFHQIFMYLMFVPMGPKMVSAFAVLIQSVHVITIYASLYIAI